MVLQKALDTRKATQYETSGMAISLLSRRDAKMSLEQLGDGASLTILSVYKVVICTHL